MDNKNLTPASHWKRNYEDGIDVEMPDGVFVRLRPTIDVTYLIGTGQIPDGLTSLALDGLNIETDNKKALANMAENVKRLNELYRIVCMATWIAPRVVERNPTDNEILFDWITKEQKEFTWNLINRPVSEWKRFLQLWRASLELVPNGTTEPPATKHITASK